MKSYSGGSETRYVSLNVSSLGVDTVCKEILGLWERLLKQYLCNGVNRMICNLLSSNKLFLTLGLVLAASCNGDSVSFERSGQTADQGDSENVAIEKAAAISGTEDDDAEAAPPEMISGAFLVCQWVDESKGEGGCGLLDADGNKVERIVTKEDWWMVVERDGGKRVETRFSPQPVSSKFHVSFGIPTVELKANASLDLIMAYPGGRKTFSLSSFFAPTETIAIGREGVSISLPLRDLVIPSSKLNSVAQLDQHFRMWPDPVKARGDLEQNAYIISTIGSNSVFDPSGYCDEQGAVRAKITDSWMQTLSPNGQNTPNVRGSVRREIAVMKIPINLASGSHCVVPINTEADQRTAVSAQGRCMFMILRDGGAVRPKAGGATSGAVAEPQPYLAIFTKAFAEAVGFTKADMEQAAVDFSCSGF